MFKRSIVVFLLGLFSLASHADPAWIPVNIGSPGETTSKMFFLDDKKTGYVLGYVSTDYWFSTNDYTYHLYKTTNGGSNWAEVALKDNKIKANKFFDLVVDSVGTIYETHSTGKQSKIYSSSDGGINWVVLTDLNRPITHLLLDRKDALYAILKPQKNNVEVDKWNAESKGWEKYCSIDVSDSDRNAIALFDKDNNFYYVERHIKKIYKISPDKVITEIPISSTVSGKVADFIIDDKTGYFYIGTYSYLMDGFASGHSGCGIYKSIDRGNGWAPIHDGIKHLGDFFQWAASYSTLLLDSQGSLYAVSTDEDQSVPASGQEGAISIIDDVSIISKLTETAQDQEKKWKTISVGLRSENVGYKLFIDKNDNLYAADSRGSLNILKKDDVKPSPTIQNNFRE